MHMWNLYFAIMSIVSSKSASVSFGKPQMMSVAIVTEGTLASSWEERREE